MGTGNHNAGGRGDHAMDKHPIQEGGWGEEGNNPSRSMLLKPELSAGLMGLLVRMQTLPTFT